MSYIIIGREPATGKLQLSTGTRIGTFGEADSVPASVSQAHCRLDFTNGKVRLRNMDINNYTYVNGQAVESKAVSHRDRIELGPDRYLLPWKPIEELVPPEADIRQLSEIWNAYDRQSIKLQIDERRFNTIRSATSLITMIAIALSIITGRQSIWYMVLYGIAILASVLFTIKAYRDASKLPQQRSDLNRKFQHDYVCPHCGHFLGNNPYDILTQNQQCPYCRAKFIH